MKKSNRSKEIQNPTTTLELLLQVQARNAEIEVPKKHKSSLLKSVFLGQSADTQLRIAIDRIKTEEQKQVRQVFKLLESHLFVIDTRAHQVATQLSKHLQHTFSSHNINLVLLGSLASGGHVLRKHMTQDKKNKPDFDCGILLDSVTNGYKEKILPDRYFDQNILINRVQDEIKFFLRSVGYELCTATNPRLYHAPVLTSIKQTESVLLSYFDIDAREVSPHCSAALYLYPTYPITVWEQNVLLTRSALKNIRRKSKSLYTKIVANMQKTLSNDLAIQNKHLVTRDHYHDWDPTYQLAKTTAELLTGDLRAARTQLLLQSKKPQYTVA